MSIRRRLSLSPLFLLVFLAGNALAPTASAQQTEQTDATEDRKPPTVEQVLTRYIEALGGEQAIRSHTSRRLTGRVENVKAGTMRPFMIESTAPDVIKMTLTLTEGIRTAGYNGQVRWILDPERGPKIDGPPPAEDRRNFDFYSELNYEKNFEIIESVGKTQFAGKACYRLRLLDSAADETFEYFEIKTGLKTGESYTVFGQSGEIEIKNSWHDWREVDGVMVHTRESEQRIFGGASTQIQQIVHYDEIEFNTVAPETFIVPDEILELITVLDNTEADELETSYDGN